MKVVLSFPNESDAKVSVAAKGSTGEMSTKDSAVSHVVIEPYFFSPKSSPTVCHLQIVDAKGVTVQRAALQLSGRQGKLGLSDRTKKVMPQYYADHETGKEAHKHHEQK